MKTFRYEPTATKGENPTFSGYVVLSAPTYEQKLDYLERLDVAIIDGVPQVNDGVYTRIKKLAAIAKPHYVEVSLTHLATGTKITSYDEMSEEGACHAIMTEISSVVLNGSKLGNG